MPVKTNNKYSKSYIDAVKKVDFGLVKTLIHSIKNTRDRLIFEIFLNSGINPSEIVELKHNDFDFLHSKLMIRKEITKDNTERIIQLPVELSEEIKKFSNEKKLYLFSSKLSPQMTLRSLHRIIENYSKEFKIKLTTHDLKKFYIENSLKEKNLDEIKKDTGLKTFSRRETLNKEKIKKIKDKITGIREEIIFGLLLAGLKPKRIANLKVSDIEKLQIDISLVNKLNEFVKKRKLERHHLVFVTRQNSILSNERILQLTQEMGKAANEKVNPRLLNNTAISLALSSPEKVAKLNFMGISKERFHLHGGFVEA